jgi:hypothetical protein
LTLRIKYSTLFIDEVILKDRSENMYYQEKKTIASIISWVLILVVYSIYGISKYQGVGANLLNDLKFWAVTMLIFIGGGIVIALMSLYIKMPPAIMLNIIFISFILGSILAGFSQLYFYRKGIRNV